MNDKTREAFEHWYSEAGRWPKAVARGEDGHYLLAQAHMSYGAWQAAAAVSDARIRQLEEALTMLYVETADYITLNSLGDVHHNQSMQLARAALNPKDPS